DGGGGGKAVCLPHGSGSHIKKPESSCMTSAFLFAFAQGGREVYPPIFWAEATTTKRRQASAVYKAAYGFFVPVFLSFCILLTYRY
ncbi:MAG TPA: hypothetical protein PKL97_02995, partial [Candidatus Omnitrophota bacterium]|nr:hypothetical protein [Candidatus Omnitrophota bacterium]